jgi:uncharacterized protein (DUF58 family)
MTTPRRPPGRYDERQPLPRWLVRTGAAVGALLLLAFAYFGYTRFSTGRTSFGLTAYHVIDDANVEVRFEVHKDLSATVICAVVARDANNVTVGRKDVTVGPAERETAQVTLQFATTHRAVSVDVTSCSKPAP